MAVVTNNIPRIAFLFIIFAVIAGGYVTNVLSCQMQAWLENSIYSRHIIGIILFFFFIMFEGGWDFDKERQAMAPVNWSKGNALHSMVYAVLIYALFTLTARSRLTPNLLLFSSLFLVYIINTQRRYLEIRNQIKKETIKILENVEKGLLVLSVIIVLYGLIDYFLYKKRIYKDQFSMYLFLLGTPRCRFDGDRDLITTAAAAAANK